MKICFLASAISAHTVKWCGYFSGKGYDVHVVTLDDGDIDGVTVHKLNSGSSADGSDAQKLAYLARYKDARAVVKRIAPDIVNAHYATSYGMLAALACKGPYILSIWGSDVFDFPNKSPLHKSMLKYSLRHATQLFSTSRAMAKEAGKYTKKPFEITPFGVDMNLFHSRSRNHDGQFVLATVKTLDQKYGIDVLLKAVAEVADIRPDIPAKVRIAGTGPQEQELKDLTKNLGIEGRVEWLGFISQERAAEVWADADIGLVPSFFESFGVAAIEAQACGTPVIVSDAPGLLETTKPGETSLVFKRGNCSELAKRIVELYDNVGLRDRLASSGMVFARDNYSYDECFKHIESLFFKFIEAHGRYYQVPGK